MQLILLSNKPYFCICFCVLSCPKHHHHITHVLQITALTNSPSTHPLQNWISYLQYSSNLSALLHSPISHHPTAQVYSLITIMPIFLYFGLQSHPLWSSAIDFSLYMYAAPALWNELPRDLHQFAHPPNPPPNLTYPPFALCPATFHSRLKSELFKLSYPDSTPAPQHVRNHHRLQP